MQRCIVTLGLAAGLLALQGCEAVSAVAQSTVFVLVVATGNADGIDSGYTDLRHLENTRDPKHVYNWTLEQIKKPKAYTEITEGKIALTEFAITSDMTDKQSASARAYLLDIKNQLDRDLGSYRGYPDNIGDQIDHALHDRSADIRKAELLFWSFRPDPNDPKAANLLDFWEHDRQRLYDKYGFQRPSEIAMVNNSASRP